MISLMLAIMLAAGTSAAALGSGWHQGNTTCTGTKTVVIWSRSSVWVDHYWKNGGHAVYYAPMRELKQSFTNATSTWWTVEYTFESDGAGGYCVQ